MPFDPTKLGDYEEMGHDDIIEAIAHWEKMGWPTAGFETCIDWAAKFEDAGLEPVFFYDRISRNMYVTSRESIDHKLH